MPPLVVDASLLVDALAGVPGPNAFLSSAMRSGHELHAPHVIDLEVVQALRRAIARRHADAAEAQRRLDLFLDLPVIRHSHLPYLARVWELRANIKAYDASYVALAESLDAPLLTRDARLARSAGHAARIELIA